MSAALHATPRQAEYLAAVKQYGSQRAAARALGKARTTVQDALHRVQGAALYDGEGKLKLKWVKPDNSARIAAELQTFKAALKTSPAAKIIRKPRIAYKDLLAVYPMGDPHFGMYAWAAEAGADFDLDIAERMTMEAIDRLVASAPCAKHALILELGDFFHADNNSARTERSGNQLDVDTRWGRVVQVGLRAMVYVIDAALRKHQHVTVRIVRGNHDPHSSYMLSLQLDAWFRNNARVTVDLSPAVFWYYPFGATLIGATHGDTCKPEALGAIMATDRPRDWGRATYRHFYHGHIHHKRVIELPGCTVESFETLAARDAWATSAGYRAGRSMTCIVHHRTDGETERHRVDAGSLLKAKKGKRT